MPHHATGKSIDKAAVKAMVERIIVAESNGNRMQRTSGRAPVPPSFSTKSGSKPFEGTAAI